jgi:excisionase family DNA binding protein
MNASGNDPSTQMLLTVAEAAAILRVADSWLYRAAKTGVFPCVRVGRFVRIRASDVHDWIESGGSAGN